MQRLAGHGALVLALFINVSGLAFSPAAVAVELKLWEEEQHAIQQVLDEAFRRFERAHPEHRIKRSHFNTEDLRVQFQLGAMAKSGPDLVLAPSDFAGVFAIMGLIQPVGAWVKPERFAERTIAAVSDAGKIWGAPINQGNHLMLFVNTRLAGTPPETLEELVTKAKRATAPASRRWGLAYHVLEPFWFVPFLSAWGERPLVEGKPNLGTPATAAALAFVHGLKHGQKVMPGDCNYACAETLFVEGKAAMTINGDWAIGKFAEALGPALALAPLPRSAATGKWPEPMISGKYLMLNERLTGKRLAAAQAFVAFMTSEATQLFLAERSKRLPSLETAAAKARRDPLLAASAAAAAHAQPMPMDPVLRAVWDAIRPQLGEVMAGRQSPEKAAAIMQKDAETKAKDMR